MNCMLTVSRTLWYTFPYSLSYCNFEIMNGYVPMGWDFCCIFKIKSIFHWNDAICVLCNDLTCIYFLKIKYLIIILNFHRWFVPAESTTCILFIFWPNKICIKLAYVVSSISLGATSDRCCYPFHWAKTSSLPPVHILTMLCSVVSHLELKLKYSIRYPL
jgi:hypothetical protein